MLVVSAILVVGYAYIAARLTSTAPVRAALAAPFIMVWVLPVVYWFGDRDRRGRVHEWVQALSFLCMGWLSFLLVLTVGRDALLLAAAALPPLAAGHTLLDESSAGWVPVAALAAVGAGALAALRGPYVRRVDIPVEGLAPDLDGFRIVQISVRQPGRVRRTRRTGARMAFGCLQSRQVVRAPRSPAQGRAPCLAGAGTRDSPKWSRSIVPSYSRRNNPRA